MTVEGNTEAQTVFCEFSDLLHHLARLHARRRHSDVITDSDVKNAFSDIVTPARTGPGTTVASSLLLFVGGIFGGLVSFHWSFLVTGLVCGAFGAAIPFLRSAVR